MKNFDKKIIKKDHMDSRTFRYQLGEVSLTFSLRTDVKQNMKDFLELLVMAQGEVKEELNKN